MKVLIVVDMQNDFISGSLGSSMAEAIVDRVAKFVDGFDGRIIFTRDTHQNDYLSTSEGQNLPIVHCIENSDGWQITDKISVPAGAEIINKETFGSLYLGARLKELDNEERVECVTLVGLCTDICVISNAYIVKAALPEANVVIDASLCAGVSEESHKTALAAMKACQISVIGE